MVDSSISSHLTPLDEPRAREERFRIEMTANCRDAEAIPKVLGAGQIVRDGERDVQIMHNGLRVVSCGYHGAWMAEIIKRLRGHHEPQEEAVFHEIIKLMPEKPRMIELGCFWAYYSLWMLQARPDASVIGVEPDAKHIEIGKQNAALNSRKMTFVEASVGGQTLDPRPFETESSGVKVIPQVSVPQLMADAGIDRLDLLHCDTQGVETEILLSCAKLFETGAIRFCLVSTHHHFISGDPLTHQRCLRIIEAAGGSIIAEHSVAESFSGDGLIAAYFGKDPILDPGISLSYNRTSSSLFRDPLFDLAEASV